METKHRTEAARRQNDHFLKRLLTAKATLPASQPRKRHRLPAQPARRKRTLFCSPDFCQNRPQRKRDFVAKPFQPKTETAQTLKACKATEQARTPASRLWRMNFERATAKKIVNLEKFRTAQRFALGAVGGTGILLENGRNPKPKNCSKTRRRPTVACTLCWADAHGWKRNTAQKPPAGKTTIF